MAAFTNYSDQDTWSLAFYVLSLRHKTYPGIGVEFKKISSGVSALRPPVDLLLTTSAHSDADLEAGLLSALPLSPRDRAGSLAALRLHSAGESAQASIALARFNLQDALSDYQAGHFESASKKALAAYVEGVEPVEPRLKAGDPRAVADLEQLMGLVRAAIRDRKSSSEIGLAVQKAADALGEAEKALQQQAPSPWLTFTLALGILIREGFEAVLLIVALLGVLKVSKAPQAERWVHGGWLAAVGCGLLAWFFSGWLMGVSGLGRELMEAVTGLVTVAILLYIGFWLHSRTEIHRWRTFIEVQVKAAVEEKNLIQLAFISFLAAFREAIETVLFLRAIWLEGGSDTKLALGLGVATAFVIILLLGWLLLTFSAKVPIKTLFNLSSMIMIALAVILTGKAVHSLQEIDYMSITLSPLNIHFDWLGLYPTRETTIFQLLVLGLSLLLWVLGKKSPASRTSK
jgi:high-affinity iron transporter